MKKYLILIMALASVAIGFFHSPVVGAAVALFPVAGTRGLTVKDLENFANNQLSSFDGADFEGENFENFEEYPGVVDQGFEGYEDYEFEGYTGAYDDFVDFGGFNKSFATAGDSGRIFVMTITNAATTSLTAYIVPGYFYYYGHSIPGVVKDGAFNDKDSTAGLTGSGSPKTIADFLSFVDRNPTHVGGIKIEGSLAAQVSQQLIIEHLSPFKQLEQKIINLGSYQNENTYRDKIVTVPTPDLVISNQTRISLVIPAGCTTVLTWLAGGVLNNSHALQQKVSRAKKTLAGGAPKRRPVTRRRPGLPAGR